MYELWMDCVLWIVVMNRSFVNLDNLRVTESHKKLFFSFSFFRVPA